MGKRYKFPLLLQDLYDIVIKFKTGMSEIKRNCKKMAEAVLFKIERKRVFECHDFNFRQKAHIKEIRSVFEMCVVEIKSRIDAAYETFAFDSDEVSSISIHSLTQACTLALKEQSRILPPPLPPGSGSKSLVDLQRDHRSSSC